MHNMKTFVCKTLTAIVAVVLCACHNNRPNQSTIIPDTVVRVCREGDIVLREGTAIESRVVSAADRRSHFTHCGLVARMGKELVVIHAVPQEPDYEGDVDRVKAEPIRQFFSTKRAKRGCVLRCLTDSATAHRAAQKAVELVRRRTLFDHDYNDRDTTQMYCSELVVFAYASAGMEFRGLHRSDYFLVTTRLHNVLLPSEFTNAEQVQRIADF